MACISAVSTRVEWRADLHGEDRSNRAGGKEPIYDVVGGRRTPFVEAFCMGSLRYVQCCRYSIDPSFPDVEPRASCARMLLECNKIGGVEPARREELGGRRSLKQKVS
jgi:hypothetical protein